MAIRTADAGRQDTRTVTMGGTGGGRRVAVGSPSLSTVQPMSDSEDDDADDASDGGTTTTSIDRAGRMGKAMSDCYWCQYGKPAAVGAAVGAGLAYLAGEEVTRGALWGVGGGLLYGFVRG